MNIPYGKQEISQDDINAVVDVLKSNFLTQGPKVDEFEIAFAKYIGSKYAIAVSNGTAALHLCALALDVNPGDKVITSPITFAASANCISYCGGEVVFADIDPDTFLLDIKAVRKLLKEDDSIKGIIPVDFAGRSVNMQEFRDLANEFNCWILEDACHAPGAFFKNKDGDKVFAGSGKYADLAIFSFHPVKHIAAGEGGMITTNDARLYEKLKLLRTHGISKNEKSYQNSIDIAIGAQNQSANSETYPKWYMEMQYLGYNYRLSDINCALGLSQLKRAKEGLKKRQRIAEKYHSAFKKVSQINDKNVESEATIANENGHAHHLYVLEVEDRLGLYDYLRTKGIFAQIHYIPCHLMPFYQRKGWSKGDFPFAEAYYSRCISIPMFPSLTDSDQERVIQEIKNYYK